jgi:hypothetical protein
LIKTVTGDLVSLSSAVSDLHRYAGAVRLVVMAGKTTAKVRRLVRQPLVAVASKLT